jgi:putative hemolysin
MVYYAGYIVAFVISVAGVAFFAGSELAFVSSNRFRLRGMAREGLEGASIAQGLLKNPQVLLSVTLVGTNVFVILASSLATALLSGPFGAYAVPISTMAVTAVVLVFGEILPKAVSRTNPEVFLVRVGAGLRIAYYVLYPLAMVTSSIAALTIRFSPSRGRQADAARDEIKALVKEAAQSGFGLTSGTPADRVLDLSRMKVTAVMLPMDEVVCIDEEASVSDALKLASVSGHSRYPVYKRNRDNLVGVLHVRDLLGVPADSGIRVFARSAYFVPETQTVKKAILDMRYELRHLGMVTDEYGRPIGLLTFEDLVEEIMGEISDEYDRVGGSRLEIGAVISGSTPVDRLNEELRIELPKGAYDTVAGLILDLAGRIPKSGEVIEYDDFAFHVTEVRGKRIRRVRITKREG